MEVFLRSQSLKGDPRKGGKYNSWSGIEKIKVTPDDPQHYSPRLLKRSISNKGHSRSSSLSLTLKRRSTSKSASCIAHHSLKVFESATPSGGVHGGFSASPTGGVSGGVSRGRAESLQRLLGSNQRKLTARKSMGCISVQQEDETANAAMEFIDGECLSENELRLMTVQARFPNDDLKLFECYSLSKDLACLDRGSFDGSGGQKEKLAESDQKSNNDSESASPANTTSNNSLQRPRAADGYVVLSPLLQNKFKKMAQRRQSAPSVVIRSVLNRSMRLTAHSHNNGGRSFAREDSDEGHPIDCLPFGFRTNNHELPINLAERQYVREGRVQLSAGSHTQDRYLFLFTDIMVIAKSKSTSNYKMKNRIKLSEVWMSAERLDEVSETTRTPECGFVIGWPTTNYIATFSSPELRELWWNDLSRLVEQSQDREDHQCLSVNISFHNANNTVTTKLMSVHSQQTAKEAVEQALQAFSCEENSDNYQMWVTTGKDNSSFPLIGHERPHAIKMSCIRDAYANASPSYDDITNDVMYLAVPGEQLSPKHECHFHIHHRSRCQRLSTDSKEQKRLARLKSKTPGTFFGWARKRSLSRNNSRHGNSERSPNQRAYSDSWESCDEQSANHLIPSPTPSGASECSSPKLFSRPLAQLGEDGELPRPVLTLLEILSRKGPNTNGIFRKSANARTTRVVKEALNQELDCDLTNVHVHVVAALLKDFLRNIPNSLLGAEHFRTWEVAMERPTDDEKIEAIKSQVESLDESTRALLRHLVAVLCRIAEKSDHNGMTSFNLAVCFAPSLMWLDHSTDLNVQASCSKVIQELIRFMIDNCRSIFGDEISPLLNLSDENEDNASCKTDDLAPSGDEQRPFDGDADDTTEDDKDGREDSAFNESVCQFDRGRATRKQLQRKRSSRKVAVSNINIASSMDSLDQDILEAELVMDRAKTELQQSLAKYETKKKTHSTSSSDDRTSQRRHSADVCSLSNDSGFTTLSGDDDETHSRRRATKGEEAGMEGPISGGRKNRDSGLERLLGDQVDLADLAERDHVTAPAKEDHSRRRSEPIIRRDQGRRNGQQETGSAALEKSFISTKLDTSLHFNTNNNNNTNTSNNILADKYLQTIRQSSVDHIFTNSLAGLSLPETLFEVNDDCQATNDGKSSAERPQTLNIFPGRRRASLEPSPGKETRTFYTGAMKHGSRHSARRSSYTHGCHLQRLTRQTSSERLSKSSNADSIFYTKNTLERKAAEPPQDETSPVEASQVMKSLSKPLTPVSPAEKPKSAFVPCEYTAAFCGGIPRNITPTRCRCESDKANSSSGFSSDASTPVRRRRSRPKLNGALNDALKTSKADGASLFSLSLPSKSSSTNSSDARETPAETELSNLKRAQLKKVHSLDRRLRSSASVPGLATSPTRNRGCGHFDRSMSGSVRARINAFNRGDVSNASRKVSDTAIRDALLFQHQEARKSSMPAAYVKLDSMLDDFAENSHSLTEKHRKENLVTRDGGAFSKSVCDVTKARKSVEFQNEGSDGQRRLSDEALLSLSESLAFGNRKTPRSSFSKPTSATKPHDPDVEGSNPARRRSRRKRGARLSHGSSNVNNNNNNNLKHSISCDETIRCSPIVFQLKELENAAESYV